MTATVPASVLSGLLIVVEVVVNRDVGGCGDQKHGHGDGGGG